MSRRARAAITLLLGAGLLAFFYPILSRLERVEEEVHVKMQGEAKADPFLAAERFLDRMGIPARGVRSLDEMPPRDHVLVLGEDSRLFTQKQITDLVTWIAGGGRLVMSPASEETDPVLSVLGIECVPPGDPENGKAKEFEASIHLSDPDDDSRVRLRTGTRFKPRRPTGTKREFSEPSLMMTLPVMSGSVTALASLDFMKNEEIGDLDHARLLWRLVRYPRPPAGVWLIRGNESASLIAILWRYAWMPIVGAALALAAWVWKEAFRFGPMLPPPSAGSRSLMEHLDAVGAFLWRRGRQEALLESTREAFGRALAARRPYLPPLPAAARSTALAAGASVPRKDILSALAAPCPRDPERFTRAIGTLETLRRAL